MIVRWGRKGLVAGAFAVAFVTAVAPTPTLNKVQLRPDVRQEVRHVTPTGVVVTTDIKRAYIRPDERFEFKHLTPVEVAAVPVIPYQDVGNDGPSEDILRDDKEIIELIQLVLRSGVLDESV